MGEGNTTAYAPHCLHRDFSGELFAITTNVTVVDWAMKSLNFWWLDRNIEGYGLTIDGLRVHGGGHISVGGQVGTVRNQVCVIFSILIVCPFLDDEYLFFSW
jgi:tyrosinase